MVSIKTVHECHKINPGNLSYLLPSLIHLIRLLKIIKHIQNIINFAHGRLYHLELLVHD